MAVQVLATLMAGVDGGRELLATWWPVQAVSDVLADRHRYNGYNLEDYMNVFGLQLCFCHSLEYSLGYNFDYYCKHDDLNAAIAENQLNIRKSLKKEEKQKALFTAWRQCDNKSRGEKRKFDA